MNSWLIYYDIWPINVSAVGSLVISLDFSEVICANFGGAKNCSKSFEVFFTDIWIHLIYAMGQQKVNGKVYLDLREAPCVEFSKLCQSWASEGLPELRQSFVRQFSLIWNASQWGDLCNFSGSKNCAKWPENVFGDMIYGYIWCSPWVRKNSMGRSILTRERHLV